MAKPAVKKAVAAVKAERVAPVSDARHVELLAQYAEALEAQLQEIASINGRLTKAACVRLRSRRHALAKIGKEVARHQLDVLDLK